LRTNISWNLVAFNSLLHLMYLIGSSVIVDSSLSMACNSHWLGCSKCKVLLMNHISSHASSTE
jgi:hypothetical protein